jgi:uncharacterized protein
MEKTILSFINLLRSSGLKITISEVQDCYRAIQLVGVEKEKFYSALKATLVKDEAQSRTFKRLFKHYFEAGLREPKIDKLNLSGIDKLLLKELAKAQGQLINRGDLAEGSTGTSGGKQGTGRAGGITGERFVTLIQLGGTEDLRRAVLEAVAQLGDLNEEHIAKREELLREIKVWLEWKMGESVLEKMFPSVSEATIMDWQEKILLFEEIVNEEVDLKLLDKFGEVAMHDFLARSNLNQLDFYKLDNDQTQEIRKKITKLAHQMATRLAHPRQRAKSGRVDMRRTIHKSLALGGNLYNLAYQGKGPAKPDLVLLCDLSGSVKIFSEFMLQLVYSLQRRFFKVRSFAFVDNVDEITECFLKQDAAEGIQAIYNHGKFSKTGFSDYGRVWVGLLTKYPEALTRKTNIIILGDARNNYQPLEMEAFQKIISLSQGVTWLNPEPQENWNKEDSILQAYAPLCRKVHECRNLHQLEMVVRRIF